MDAGGGFFRHALDVLDSLSEVAGLGSDERLHRALHFDFFFIFWFREAVASFQLCAPKREHRGIAAIVQNHVAGGITPVEDVADIIPIFSQALTLNREHRHAGDGYGSGSVILRRIDVARRPADRGTQRGKRFNQHCGLNRHVQRSGDARALQRLRCAKFVAQCHQARHFGFGNVDFLAAKISKADISDNIIVLFEHGSHGQISSNKVGAPESPTTIHAP